MAWFNRKDILHGPARLLGAAKRPEWISAVAAAVAAFSALQANSDARKLFIAQMAADIQLAGVETLENASAGKPLRIRIPYLNVGKSPALETVATMSAVLEKNEAPAPPPALQCEGGPQSLGTVAPLPPDRRYYMNRTIPERFITPEFVAGTKFLKVAGCYTFQTVDGKHDVPYCYYVSPRPGGETETCPGHVSSTISDHPKGG